MKELSIAQEYLLCTLSEKGKLPLFGKEASACILASGLLELLMHHCIEIDEKNKVAVVGSLSGEQSYLSPLYDWLRQPKPMKLEAIAREFCVSLTEKRLSDLVTAVGNSLVEKGCAVSEPGGFLAGRPRFLPDPQQTDRVIQKIRAELLENGAISDETVALVSLLEKSYQIKRYFSSYEAKQLKARLKEIREAPSNRMVREMVEYVNTIVALIASTAAAH